MSTVTRAYTLVDQDCIACDIVFAMPDRFDQEMRRTGETFYCPRGHGQVYREPENARLRKRVAALEAQKVALDDQRRAAERSLTAQKGENTKLRNRVHNGVCPCCQRSFQNLRRHMTSKHPDYAEAHSSG